MCLTYQLQYIVVLLYSYSVVTNVLTQTIDCDDILALHVKNLQFPNLLLAALAFGVIDLFLGVAV